jgi:hypothetical protein
MVAPGTTAPVGSVTVPAISPVVSDCALSEGAAMVRMNSSATVKTSVFRKVTNSSIRYGPSAFPGTGGEYIPRAAPKHAAQFVCS